MTTPHDALRADPAGTGRLPQQHGVFFSASPSG